MLRAGDNDLMYARDKSLVHRHRFPATRLARNVKQTFARRKVNYGRRG